MKIKLLKTLTILIILAIVGCTPASTTTPVFTATIIPTLIPTPTVTVAPEVPLQQLTYDDLMNNADPVSPINEGAFTMPPDAALPEYTFEGRLELQGEADYGRFQKIDDQAYGISRWAVVLHLPEFDYEFVQGGHDLIPVQRGLLITTHPLWNYILEPGNVWQTKEDHGYARASFPFALVQKGQNCTFNGVMLFLFNNTSISKVRYQITQETCLYFKGDFWGQLEAVYHPGPVVNAEQVRVDYAREAASRFPTKPIEQLAVDYPGTDLSQFGKGITPEHMTVYGFVINGVNYVSGCRTRYGTYAYCDNMRLPSYSTAKSAFASLALMRLGQKYGPEVANLLIKDYVPEAAQSAGDWSKVTFNNTLDMATGNYLKTNEADPGNFIDSMSYKEKITQAFSLPYSAPPGTQFVYHTSDIFILVRAMQNYLRSQENAHSDIFDFVVKEVYIPIKIGPGAFSSLRTQDEESQAYGGYGLWWTTDDIAKLASLLNNGNGRVNGNQLLQPVLLAAGMQRDPLDRGVDTGVPDQKYNNAIWADKYSTTDGYPCDFWVPQMNGFGAIVIAMMPNGTTYYYFSDHNEFTSAEAVKESDKIKPHCP